MPKASTLKTAAKGKVSQQFILWRNNVNNVLKTILDRRSIRLFKAEQIKQEDIDSIIEAGLYAPSANNAQDWHFTVLQSKDIIEKVNGWLLDEVENSGNPDLQEIVKGNGGRFFRNAPTVIIVSTDKKYRFGVINASAATENMLIASKSLGIGSCWIGSVEMLSASKHVDFFAKELQLPDGFAPQFGVTLGYGEGASPPVPERRKNCVSYIS